MGNISLFFLITIPILLPFSSSSGTVIETKSTQIFFTQYTQDVNWTYIRRSEDVLDVFWTPYVRSVCVLCLLGLSTIDQQKNCVFVFCLNTLLNGNYNIYQMIIIRVLVDFLKKYDVTENLENMTTNKENFWIQSVQNCIDCDRRCIIFWILNILLYLKIC